MNYICRNKELFDINGCIFNMEENKFSLSLIYIVPKESILDENGNDISIPGEDIDTSFNGKRVIVKGPFYISLEELKSRQEWKDRSVWSILIKTDSMFMTPVSIINKDAESMPMRRSPGITSMVYNTPILFDMLVPFVDSDFNDISFIFYVGKDFVLLSNVNFEEINMENAMTLRNTLLPTIYLDGPNSINAGGITNLNISSFWNGAPCTRPITVELETVNGYLPKTRLTFTEHASFPVMALGLVEGDSMRIKAGFRYRASVDEKNLEVTD